MTNRQPAAVLAAAREAFITRRIERRLSQAQVAELSGVSLRAIQNFESGTVWPQPITRAKLEVALGWEPRELDRIAAEVAA